MAEVNLGSHTATEAFILTTLYVHEGPMRSKYIVEKVRESENISQPTVYSILRDLERRGLIKRIEISPRNVQYELTDMGRRLIEEEYLKARETLLSALRNLRDKDEIVVEILTEEILEELPEEWKRPENIEKIKKILKEEIETAIKRVTRTTMILREG